MGVGTNPGDGLGLFTNMSARSVGGWDTDFTTTAN